MKKISFVMICLLLCFLSIFALSADAATVAIEVNDYDPSSEHDALTSTLTNLGHTVVDVTTVDEAQNAGACTIISYAGGDTLDSADLESWVNGGKGLIQIGDWTNYFSTTWESAQATITVNITNPSHPLAQGLPSSWSGHGYFYNALPPGFLAYSNGSLTGETEIGTLQSTVVRNYGISAYDSGTGRAVFLGLNVYGPSAGANDLALLQNSIDWSCGGSPPVSTTRIPTMNEWGLIIFAVLTGLGATYYLRRQKTTAKR